MGSRDYRKVLGFGLEEIPSSNWATKKGFVEEEAL